jgi:hypothetical protein
VLTVHLPGASWIDGRRALTARLRPPTGFEEALLQDADPALSAHERLTALLAELVVDLAGGGEVGADALRTLTVGDREALALAVRRMTFGERLDCALTCTACEEPIDVPATVADFLYAPYAMSADWHEVRLLDGSDEVEVRFRLPTGADLDAAASADDPEAGAALLLSRCVASAHRTRTGAAVEPLPAAAADALAQRMAELDPQADIVLTFACPHCEQPLEAPFDATRFLLEEFAGASTDLLGEVHALASHYHWSEREILELPVPRRRLYLELVADGGPEP